MDKKTKALLASYGRSVLSAAVALYLAGVTDPLDLVWALAAGILPVGLRAVNPKDPAFGRVPSLAEVDKALKSKSTADAVKAGNELAEMYSKAVAAQVAKANSAKAPAKKAPAKVAPATPAKPVSPKAPAKKSGGKTAPRAE